MKNRLMFVLTIALVDLNLIATGFLFEQQSTGAISKKRQ
jgi:hypothetical protein